MRTRMRLMLLLAIPAAALPAVLAAQEDTVAVRADTVACDGQTISAIQVNALPPAAIARSSNAIRRFVLRVLFQSATTEERVVRSFLLVREGQRCNPARLAEAARVLRALPFIGQASISTVADTGGTVRLEIETLDEVPLVIGGSWSSGVSGVKFGNANLFGEGLHAAASWGEGGFYRDEIGVEIRNHGVFSRSLVFDLDARRRTLGHSLTMSLSRPLFSNLQRTAWHIGMSHSRAYNPFVRTRDPTLSLETERVQAAAGIVARIGGRSVGLLAGPVVMYDRIDPATPPVIVSDSGLDPVETDAFDSFGTVTTFRAGAAVGLRLLHYGTVSGFDALLGEQDIARGVQVGVVAARGFEAFGADDTDDYAALDLYSGWGGGRTFAAMRGKVEGQRPREGGDWSNVVAAGRAAVYYKPSERRTWTVSTEYSGIWREEIPAQLSLGQRGAGPRGYEGSSLPGGRRLVTRFEERRAMGAFGRYAHWGLAGFVDVSKVWAGDAPFGRDLYPRVSLGVGLLAALPPQSRRLIRIDLAVPISADARKNFIIRVSARDATRVFWREPRDVTRARSTSLPASIFGWP